MLFPSLIGHSAELFRIICKSPQPADSIAGEYFRSHKYIGSKERKFISETVFAALRMKSLAEYCAHCAEPKLTLEFEIKTILTTCLLGERMGVYSPQKFLHPSFVQGDIPMPTITDLCIETLQVKCELTPIEALQWIQETESLWLVLKNENSWIFNCLPDWISDALEPYSENIARALLPSADVGLRVNSRAISREQALHELARIGIAATPSLLAPDGIVLHNRVQLSQVDLYKSGAIEVQDIGSQLIAYAVAPEEHWTLLDACAGAGGKSLHLAALQNDLGEIIGTDVEYKRLKELDFRAHRAGLHSVRTVLLTLKNSKPLEKLIGKCDAVLVDAPCSGMGTARRMPMVKWRLTPQLVEKLARKQREILTEKSKFVRKGGVLIYATCSLFPQENQQVTDDFLTTNPQFEAEPLAPVFEKFGISVLGLGANDYYCTLNPYHHGTDGFFMARMRRVE
ncbi:MAG: RsmB/NOP family class I SAM-dependent RNA methyltransferase [Ignavibacteria bacterium]|nr:RsmB/NOP family class I SAM-dependent RNA methyltransferase [Ignavibacteria bacterium]